MSPSGHWMRSEAAVERRGTEENEQGSSEAAALCDGYVAEGRGWWIMGRTGRQRRSMKNPCSRPGDASNIKARRKQFSPGFPQSGATKAFIPLSAVTTRLCNTAC